MEYIIPLLLFIVIFLLINWIFSSDKFNFLGGIIRDITREIKISEEDKNMAIIQMPKDAEKILEKLGINTVAFHWSKSKNKYCISVNGKFCGDYYDMERGLRVFLSMIERKEEE